MSETAAFKSEKHESEYEHLSRILKLSYDRVLREQCQEEDSDDEKISLIAKNALEKSVDVVGENNSEFFELVRETRDAADGSAKKFSALLASAVAKHFLSLHTLSELEEQMRKNTIERHGHTEIGRMLCCEFTGPNTIALHATPTFFANPKDFKDILFTDLKAILDKLQQDEKFASIKKITVASHMVERLKLTLAKAGFTNFTFDSKTQIGTAEAEVKMFITEVQKLS